MKNDTTSTLLNFILAALVILGVLFAAFGIMRQRQLNTLLPEMQNGSIIVQVKLQQAQAMLNDAIVYNKQQQNAELAKIISIATAPAAQPAAAAK